MQAIANATAEAPKLRDAPTAILVGGYALGISSTVGGVLLLSGLGPVGAVIGGLLGAGAFALTKYRPGR